MFHRNASSSTPSDVSVNTGASRNSATAANLVNSEVIDLNDETLGVGGGDPRIALLVNEAEMAGYHVTEPNRGTKLNGDTNNRQVPPYPHLTEYSDPE